MVLRFACVSWTLLWLASTQSTFLEFFRCSQFSEFDSNEGSSVGRSEGCVLFLIFTGRNTHRIWRQTKTARDCSSSKGTCELAGLRKLHEKLPVLQEAAWLSIRGFLCAQVSSGNCETMESWKKVNFNPKYSLGYVRILIYRMWAFNSYCCSVNGWDWLSLLSISYNLLNRIEPVCTVIKQV